METAEQGNILIIDNSGSLDIGCIGDLTAKDAVFAAADGVLFIPTQHIEQILSTA